VFLRVQATPSIPSHQRGAPAAARVAELGVGREPRPPSWRPRRCSSLPVQSATIDTARCAGRRHRPYDLERSRCRDPRRTAVVGNRCRPGWPGNPPDAGVVYPLPAYPASSVLSMRARAFRARPALLEPAHYRQARMPAA